MRELLLDIHGEANPVPGCRRIETELDFLQALSEGKSPVLVCGEHLCEWAGAIWQARGWRVQRLTSLVDELLLACPDLSREQARVLSEHHGELRLQARPLTLQRITEIMFPSQMWRRYPDISHAAEWLLWLDENAPPVQYHPILRGWAMRWRSEVAGPEAMLYSADDAQRARELLSAWLGYSDIEMVLPVFPLPVPQRHADAAAQKWLPRIIDTRGRYFGEIRQRPLPLCMTERAAELTCQYYHQNPSELSEKALTELSDYILPNAFFALQQILPPPVPAEPPVDPGAIKKWFKKEYLPFRQWLVRGENVAGRSSADTLCRQFASWYLGFYPRAIARGDDCIAYFKAALVPAQCEDNVVLLVILDGLQATDGATLLRHLRQQHTRLTASVDDLVFSPIPTVTEVCKPALVRGCAPRDSSAARIPNNVKILSEGRDPTAELEQAVAGRVFVWTLAEPDQTYHAKADRHVLLQRVEGVLRTCAERILAATKQVPSHLKLKIIVTTDHGRLFQSSERACPIPLGMTAHQRAAWGRSSRALPPSGVSIEEEQQIAYLDGPLFGISNEGDCAIVLSEKSFFMSDGKSGTEQFAHGGLFPEEVIVPWIELLRDVEGPNAVAKITGKAREGAEGRLTVAVTNSSQISLQATWLEIAFGTAQPRHFELDHEIAPLTKREYVISVADWPAKPNAISARAWIGIRPPAGPEIRIETEVVLDSEGFYVQDADILGDLT
ncbi:MAG: hypothetical protein LLG01_16025 [Planctomycetaceae bacterium]|nr:hypothetical protein [Planctomycetaceae bacterium]